MSGLGSIGIKAVSAGAAEVDVVNVTARAAKAIAIEAQGDASLAVRGAVRSVNDDGALVSGSDVRVTLAAGSSLSGGINGLVVRANGPAPLPEEPGTSAAGTALITNLGLIRGGDGHAVVVEAGTALLENKGSIAGSVLFGAGDDKLLNSGTHEIWSNSDFGGGSDLYKNLGEVRLSVREAPLAIKLTGLELFDNHGRISLANGTAGDVLNLSGNYQGSGAASLMLDLDPAAGKVDHLAVAGTVSGRTKLGFSIKGPASLLGDDRLVIAKAGTGSAEDAFELSWADAGFVRYGVTYDAAASEYVLESGVGEGAYRASSIVAGIRHGLADLGESWSAHDAQQRDSDEPGRGFWAVGSIASAKGERHFEAGGQRSAMRYDEDRQSYLAGIDLWAGAEGSGLSGGVLAGYHRGTFDFRNSADESGTETVLAGVYARYRRGPLFANVVAQYARHWLRFEAEQLAIDERSTGSSIGARLEAGYRIGSDSWYFEPIASVAVHKQRLNSFAVDNQTLELSGRSGARVSVGARSGASLTKLGESTLRGSAAAGFARDFGSRERLLLTSGDNSAEARTEGERGSVWTTLGLELDGSGPISGFA